MEVKIMKISKKGIVGALAGVGLLAYGVFKMVSNKPQEDVYVECDPVDEGEDNYEDDEDESDKD